MDFKEFIYRLSGVLVVGVAVSMPVLFVFGQSYVLICVVAGCPPVSSEIVLDAIRLSMLAGFTIAVGVAFYEEIRK